MGARYKTVSLSPLFTHFRFYLKLRQTRNQAVSSPQEQKVSFLGFLIAFYNEETAGVNTLHVKSEWTSLHRFFTTRKTQKRVAGLVVELI